MSLLQQNSQEQDDAARGEELTKGSSNVWLAGVIAAVVVSIAIFLYIKLGEKPMPATGEVTNLSAHLMHRETPGLDANGAPMAQDKFDQVLVFGHAKLRNQSKQPLFMHEIMTNVTLDDGVHVSYAAPPTDYERLFKVYPELAALHASPLAIDLTLQPGQSAEGDFVSSFRMTKQEWDSRKGLDFTFAFRYQPLLKVVPAGPVTDR
jgi:hypothetical protein